MGVLSVFIFDIYFVGLILTIGAFVFGAIGLHRSPYRRIPGRKTAVWAMSLGGIYFAMTNINLLQQFVNALR